MARTLLRGGAALVVTGAAAAALAWTSAVPWASHGGDAPRLRLSWSAVPERIEVCRRLSPEELATREAHMRQAVECDGRFATYALEVDVDSVAVARRVLRGGGLRHDRPMHVLDDVAVPTGSHHLRVTVTRVEQAAGGADSAFAALAAERPDTGLFAGRAQREAVEHTRRERAALPARLALDTVVSFDRGRLVLVTLSGEPRALSVIR